MSVQIVRFSTDPQRVPEVREAIDRMFTAIAETAPAGLTYTAAQVGEDAEFLLTLELADDASNPLPEIAAAAAFRSDVARWAGAPVPPRELRVLGRYPQ